MAPFSVTFDGSGSHDSDGSIASYQWAFGDGATGSGPIASHTYTTGATFTAKLTVTDNQGATSTTQLLITVQPDPATVLHVSNITVTPVSTGGWSTATAAVTVVDGKGATVSGVTVTGNWSGAVTGSASASTGTTGIANVSSKRYKKAGSVTFTVSNLSKNGYTYNPGLNVITKKSNP